MMSRLLFSFLIFTSTTLAQEPVDRKINFMYVRNPDESAEENRAVISGRQQDVVDGLNDAMDFHEIDYRFSTGALYEISSEHWGQTGNTCVDVLNKICTQWAAELGRVPGSIDLWVCIVSKGFSNGSKCAGMAKVSGNLAFVNNDALRKTYKIGVFHEIGHNLGCGRHESGFCAPEWEAFQTATGKRTQTLMGGGGACGNLKGVQGVKLKLYTDKSKQYCENGACISLGNDEFDCVSKMKKLWEEKTAIKPEDFFCDDEDAPAFSTCVVAKNAVCTSRKVGGRYVPTKETCQEIINDSSTCPSGTFFYNGNRKECRCCTEDYELNKSEETNQRYTVLRLTVTLPDHNEEDASEEDEEISDLAFSVSKSELLVQSFALFGILSIFYVGFSMCTKTSKYDTISEPDEI